MQVSNKKPTDGSGYISSEYNAVKSINLNKYPISWKISVIYADLKTRRAPVFAEDVE